MAERLLAIGADGALGGWLAAACYGTNLTVTNDRRTELTLCPTFTTLMSLRRAEVQVAVDIPMGLLDSVDFRRCDLEARQLLDVLDAYAALESALHVAADDYEEIGDLTDADGLIMRMVL